MTYAAFVVVVRYSFSVSIYNSQAVAINILSLIHI